MRKLFIILLYTVASCFYASAQDTIIQDTFTGTAINNAVSFYYQYTNKQSRLYNGKDHSGYPTRINGFAYFLQNNFEKGSVSYDGLWFHEVPMIYDLYKDELVILHFSQYIKISLVSEKVAEFSFHGHRFIRLVRDSLTNPSIITGFYDLLYNGSLPVYAKRTKIIEETVSDQLKRDFIEKNFYYIKQDGVYKEVKKFQSLLSLLKDKSTDVRRYLKKNKIKYRKNRENTIVKAVAYYDTLKN